jgi:hypothetical protein
MDNPMSEIKRLKSEVDRYKAKIKDATGLLQSYTEEFQKEAEYSKILNSIIVDKQQEITLLKKGVTGLDISDYPCERSTFGTISNLRSIKKCIKNIEGQDSNSASPTDIYILDMKNSFKYEGIHIPTIYMKIFFSGSDTRKDIQLLYEYLIYSTKIKEIVKQNISPYFVKVLGGATGIKSRDFINLLQVKFKDSEYRFVTNMGLVDIGYESRPSISSDLDNSSFNFHRENLMKSVKGSTLEEKTSKINSKILDFSEYGYIMTEGTPNTISLQDKIYKSSEKELYVILFQLILACKTMNMAKIAHNDLHLGNILVEVKKVSDRNCFIVNDGKYNKFYTLTTTNCIHIYDFDIAFNGGYTRYDNRYIKEPWAADNSYSNNLIYHRDLVKVLSYFFVDDSDPIINYFPDFCRNIANILINSTDSYTKLQTFYKESGNLLFNPDTKTGRNNDIDFKLFNRTFDEMLDLTYDLIDPIYKIPISLVCNSPQSYNMYYLFPETFDEEGMVLSDTLSKIKQYITKNICTIPIEDKVEEI